MENRVSTRNAALDLLKFIASICVILIHVNFYGKAGQAVDALCRFSVPVFFLCSGYFCRGKGPDYIRRELFKVMRLLLPALVLYHCRDLAMALYEGTLPGLLSELADPRRWLKLLVCNMPLTSVHLWYLFALGYVYLIQYFLVKRGLADTRPVYIAAVSLLALHLVLGEGLSTLGVSVYVPYLRNFLLFGWPLFTLGGLLRKNQDRQLPQSALVICLLLGAAEALASRALFGKNEIYLGSVLMAVSAFLLALNRPGMRCPRWAGELFSASTYIYLFHLLVSSAVVLGAKLLGVNTDGAVFTNIKAVLVCVLTVAGCWLYVRVKNHVQPTCLMNLKKRGE